jgi:cytochrome P450
MLVTAPGCPVTNDVDWLQQDFLVDPYPKLAELRAESPVFFDEELGYYLVTRYADIEQCLIDRTTFLAQGASSPVWPPIAEAQQVLTEHGSKRVPTLNNADPPRHGPMRKAVFTCMSRARLAALEPELREYATGLVTTLVGKPVSDLVTDLTFPLPGRAGLGLLGIPNQDFDQIKEWSAGRVLLTYGHLAADEQVQVAKNVIAFWQYIENYVNERNQDRGDDFTSDVLRYHDEDPDEVTIDDIVNIVFAMALAGHDSTTNALGNMLRHVLAHQDQWRALVDDPSLIPNAVEESLRVDGPVAGHRRTVAFDTELGGVPLPAGAKLVLLFASADRDGAHFPEPDRFDVTRENAADHLSFGKGVHFCLGAPLARMEMRIALELLTEHAPGMHLVPEQDFPYVPITMFRSLEHLLVEPR